MTIGILAAMHEEIEELIAGMTTNAGALRRKIGMREYHVGEYDSQSCVVVLARIGKVAAAATAVTLIRDFGVTEIIFIGLAGGISPLTKVGDVVMGESLMQHDLDASPFFQPHEVPLLGKSEFFSDEKLGMELMSAANLFLSNDLQDQLLSEALSLFGIERPALHSGLIISGDKFVGNEDEVKRLRSIFPRALAVEMEGAAVAQICHEYDVPCAILRTISDRADDSAHVDFDKFLGRVASRYSNGILRRFFRARMERITPDNL